MTTLIYDIETDGLEYTKLHCMAILDVDTKEVDLYVGKDEIAAKAIPRLKAADRVIGHNIVAFDNPCLEFFFGWSPPIENTFDTLIGVRMMHPDIADEDFRKRPFHLEKKLYGSQSMEAWGQRLGEFKIKFKKDTTGLSMEEKEAQSKAEWANYTDEMGQYCIQDVRTNLAIYNHVLEGEIPDGPMLLEHRFAKLMHEQELDGFPFDKEGAEKLLSQLTADREIIRAELKTLFPARVEKRVSEKTGKPLKDKITEFNPGSRTHIYREFSDKYGWEPKEFTPAGKPEINAEILEALPYPEAKELLKYFQLDKVIGYLGEGANAWLKLVKADGAIHGRMNTIGAATGRCTHNAPNMGQIPSVRKPFGSECRALFHAPKGWKQVGTDLQAIETRLFAHYLALYDGGEYARFVESGDVHWYNAKAAGLIKCDPDTAYDETIKEHKAARSSAKTFVLTTGTT